MSEAAQGQSKDKLDVLGKYVLHTHSFPYTCAERHYTRLVLLLEHKEVLDLCAFTIIYTVTATTW